MVMIRPSSVDPYKVEPTKAKPTTPAESWLLPVQAAAGPQIWPLWPLATGVAAPVDVLTVYIGFHHAPAERREAFIGSCYKAVKRGGSLIVRDHDVTDPTMTHFVALAHDVFNCGLELPWSTNAAEIRNFLSLAQLQEILTGEGFAPHGKRLLQPGDPTHNTLMRFDKV